MEDRKRHDPASAEDSDSPPDRSERSKSEADRPKSRTEDEAGSEIPGEVPEDDPDREGEDRFDAG
ncbi:hypothetical protein GCM10028784_20660 [Myceligenerans cantabricum]